MEFKADSRTFLEALSFVSKGVAARTTLPILGNVLIKVNDKVSLRATNLVVDLQKTFEAQVISKGATVVPATQLLQFLKAPGVVKVKVDKMMTVEGKGKIRLGVIPADEYPSSPKVNSQVKFEIDKTELKDILDRVGFAVATDASRPILTGTYFSGGHSLVVGADGKRMAIYEFKQLKGDIEASLSQQGIEEVKRIAGFAGDKIKVEIGTKFSSFVLGDYRVIVNHLAGQYPANAVGVVNQTKNREHPIEVRLDKTSLMNTLDIAMSFQSGLLSVPIRLTCDDEIKIEVKSDVGNYIDTIAGEIIRGKSSILLSPAQIISAIRQVKSDTIVFLMGSPHQPILILDPDNDKWLVVQVPIADKEGVEKWEAEKQAEKEKKADF